MSSREKEGKVCLFLQREGVGGAYVYEPVHVACKGEAGGSGADGGEAVEGVRKNRQRSHAARPCLMPATPLSSHVGCRLLGTPAWLPVRVAEGRLWRWSFQGRWRAIE